MDKLDYLKKYFGYSSFRKGQDEIIDSIAAGNDTLAVMPTGGGKSLCYQLPALMKQGTAIVISPLIALMKDQTDALTRKGIPATFINSTINYDEIKQRLENASRNEYKLVYLAPERMETRFFKDFLENVNVSFIAVDEAHCISQWGHDFRPSYLNISRALKEQTSLPKIALTATATKKVRNDIISYLEMKNAKKFVKGFDRHNLSWIVEMPPDKVKRIISIIRQTKSGSSIIYCGSRKRAEETAMELRKKDINAEAYHAGMKSLVRKSVQERFISGKTRVIAATNAFGMGIDKADVRNVIHTDLCATLEAYYQEAGRGGRDGKPADCYLLYDIDDRGLQDFFIDLSYPYHEDFDSVWHFIIDSVDSSGILKRSDVQIGNELALSANVVKNIINYFEREGALKRILPNDMLKIHFEAEIDSFRDFYRNTTQSRKDALEAIMRSSSRVYAGGEEVFTLQNFCMKHQLKNQAVIDTLKALQINGLLDYSHNDKSGIQLIDSEYELDYSSIKFGKKLAKEKLEKVINYAETESCKRAFILNYFGESAKENCGNCSSCLPGRI